MWYLAILSIDSSHKKCWFGSFCRFLRLFWSKIDWKLKKWHQGFFKSTLLICFKLGYINSNRNKIAHKTNLLKDFTNKFIQKFSYLCICSKLFVFLENCWLYISLHEFFNRILNPVLIQIVTFPLLKHFKNPLLIVIAYKNYKKNEKNYLVGKLKCFHSMALCNISLCSLLWVV